MLCLLTPNDKKEREIKKVWLWRMLKSLWRNVCIDPLILKLSHSDRTCGLVIPVPHIILPKMTPNFMISPGSTSLYREVQAMCLPPNKEALHESLTS